MLPVKVFCMLSGNNMNGQCDTGKVIYAGHAAQAFGRAGSEPPLDVLTSVAGQQKVILGISQKQTGMFLNWNGERLDW